MSEIVYMNDLLDFVTVLEEAQGKRTQDLADKVTHLMGERVADLAYLYAPKDTGKLANLIQAIHSPGESRVVATAPHAAFVEFGTWSHNVLAPKSGTYEIRPVNARALRFTAADGRVVYTQVVHHPGIRAQPFLARANAEVIEEFTGGIANVGMMLLVNP